MTALAIAVFDAEGPFLRARTRALASEWRIVGEWLPYAADHLGEGPGQRRIRLAVVLAGLAGGLGLLALTAWSAILAYPFNEGRRPLWSWPAFIPAPIEFGALTAAISGVVMLFLGARLTRLHHAAFEWDEVAEASQGRFVLALGCDAGADSNATLALLSQAGAAHTRLIGG